ncbi:MAG: RHS repeat domain-containing protein, partial [Cyclobacteriaceae bacterium]
SNSLKSLLTEEQVMTIYLYDSYGITETIDPNGRSTKYHYDDYGRLIYVKDDNNNILQQTEYNYKNQ